MESRLHAFLNFWGLILGAAIGAAALIWTGSRARQTAEIAQVVSELKLQNERVNQEIQRSRAETERWKSEAEQLRRRLEQRPTHSQPPEKPICPPSLPETIPPPPEEAGSTTKQTQPRTVAKTRLNQISYEVVGCKGQERVTCDLMLTNHDQDRWFHIDPKTSYMIDDSGDQYYGTEAKIVRKASDRWQNLKTLLVSGVTVRSSITFDGVAVHAKRLSLLDLSVSSSTAGDHHVQFHNVALVKSQ